MYQTSDGGGFLGRFSHAGQSLLHPHCGFPFWVALPLNGQQDARNALSCMGTDFCVESNGGQWQCQPGSEAQPRPQTPRRRSNRYLGLAVEHGPAWWCWQRSGDGVPKAEELLEQERGREKERKGRGEREEEREGCRE